MDYLTFLPWILLLWPAVHLILSLVSSSGNKKLPPGPLPLPIIGNLFLIGDSPHKSITELAKIHGPLMYLQLGSQGTVVVSSALIAKEVLHKNDASVCSRTIPDCVTALRHHELSFLYMPISSQHWKSFRRICNSHVLSKTRLDASQFLRRNKLEDLLSYVKLRSQTNEAVEIGQVAFKTTLNLLLNTFFSVDLVNPNSSTCREFKEIISQIMLEAVKPNFSDYFPVFKRLDLQGIRRRIGVHYEKMFSMFNSMISHRLAAATEGCLDEKDALDALLKLSHDDGEELQLSHIPHLLMDLFVAGTDTTSGIIEWAMTELLCNPDKMNKARRELELVAGKGIMVKEEDIHRLPYLEAIIKETFRAHTSAAFIPRRATCEVEICGFTIPKNSTILINLWAMGKDPTVWDNSGSFEPERFLGRETDIMGREFELIPFGSGRRICPGMSLAMRMIPLMLGSLINCFEWKLEDNVEPKNMDMEARFGLSL